MIPKNTSLLIATPAYNQVCFTPFVYSLFNLAARLGQLQIKIEIKILTDSFLHRLRNTFASDLLHSSHTHLLMIDNDIEFNPEAVVEMLRSGKELIAAACSTKTYNWERVAVATHVGLPPAALPEIAGSVIAWGGDAEFIDLCAPGVPDIVPVPAIGAGVLLIHRTAFEKVRDKMPELQYKLTPDGKEKQRYWNFFAPLVNPESNVLMGEDYSFCLRASSVGIQSFLLTKYRSVHYGIHGFICNKAARQEIDARIAAIKSSQQQDSK